MIVCAGQSENFDFAKPIGIGLVNAAMHLTELIIDKKPDHILFVGTAGSYGAHNFFDIVYSEHSSNIEIASLGSLCYTPLENVITTKKDQFVSRETNTIVNSSNYITSDANSGKRFRDLGLDLENMEFFSIVSVCKHFQIPAKGIFIITNYSHSSAHNEFIRNHQKAKSLLNNYVKDNHYA